MQNDRDEVLTPKERPNHHVIGRYFRAWDGEVYFCDSYQYGPDYWMTNILDGNIRRGVSTAAIGRTFHEVGTEDRPFTPEAIKDRENYAVDTRLPFEDMTIAVMADAACLGLDQRVALFCCESDAKRFLRIVQAAVDIRKAALAEKSANAS